MATIYDFTLEKPDGTEVSLSEFRGRPMLIVNSATGCGFTPQYEDLKNLYNAYHDQGLEIVDIPCDQFGHQAPGTDDEIHEFCTMTFGTPYQQYRKSEVNGSDQLPLYAFLKEAKGFTGFTGEKADFMDGYLKENVDPDYASNDDIKWNFTKFLVDRDGNVVARFEPTVDMALVEDAVKGVL